MVLSKRASMTVNNNPDPPNNPNGSSSGQQVVNIPGNPSCSQNGIGRSMNDHWIKNKDTARAIGYLMAIVTFLVTFNLKSLPKLPYPIIGNLLDWDPTVFPKVWYNGAVLLVLLWGVMYCCKMTIIVIGNNYCAEDTPSTGDGTVAEQLPTPFSHYLLPVMLYHSFFGFWIGWSTNVHITYMTSETEYLAAGICLFALSEAAFVLCNILQLTQGHTKAMQIVVEVSDLTILLGFAVASLTMSSFTMFLSRMVIALISVSGLVDTTLF